MTNTSFQEHTPMTNEREPIVVPVNASTFNAYDHFEALLRSEGTQSLQDQWSILTSQLREYLQIEEPFWGPLGPNPGRGSRRP